MTSTDPDAERVRRRLSDLEDRVHTLESIAIRTLAVLTGALLVLGSALPTFTDGTDELVTVRLLTAPFEIFGSLGENGDDEGFGVVMGLGFLALLACIAAAVGICFVQWHRWARPGFALAAKVIAWLLLVGMLVPVYFTFASANADLDDVPGPAMWFFVPGVIAFAATALNEHLRQLWCQEV